MGDTPQSDGTGRVLTPVYQGARAPAMDSRSAASEALIAYLKNACFSVRTLVKDAEPREFRFTTVSREWPEPSKELITPTLTVLDFEPTMQDAWGLVPAPLEDTLDVFGDCTVLWKTAELIAQAQVEFWLGNEPEREAVAAKLPTLFAPAEDEWGVRLQTPPDYFCRVARFSLMSMQRMDDANTIYPRERRLSCRIGVQLDEVQLRSAPRTRLTVDMRVKQPDDPT